jgi:ubiquinol-cytochrome c reductase iron-sulfur subunit
LNKSIMIAALLACSVAGSIGFATAYALGANTQLEGLAALTALGFLAAAIVVWERSVVPQDADVEEREPLPSASTERDAAVETFDAGFDTVVARGRWLLVMLGGAVGTLVLAALFPIRSLTPAIGDKLAQTAWRAGLRLVRSDGTPLRADDLAVGSVVTAFPEGYVGEDHERDMATAAVMLVRVPPEQLDLSPDRRGWAPHGCLAYSKVCTHAGCPVGLYRATAHELFCPCHQSTFDVLRDGKVLFGPADRALPQLPIAVRADGFLIAQGDFSDPIGPGYWERS